MGRQGAPKGVARALAQAWRPPRGPLARGVSRRRGRVRALSACASRIGRVRAGSLRPRQSRGVCATTCARRGCTGCCFCVGVRLPVYLEIHTGESLRCNQTAACGLAAGGAFELQIGHSGARPKDGDSETASPRLPYPGCLTQAASSARAVPAYLLDRQTTRQRSWGTVLDDLSLGCGSDLGRVIYLPGAVRSRVAADQLAEYTERLACSGTLVEILSGDSCECTLGPGRAHSM